VFGYAGGEGKGKEGLALRANLGSNAQLENGKRIYHYGTLS